MGFGEVAALAPGNCCWSGPITRTSSTFRPSSSWTPDRQDGLSSSKTFNFHLTYHPGSKNIKADASDLKHASKSTKTWLQKKSWKILEWPSPWPDLNHCVQYLVDWETYGPATWPHWGLLAVKDLQALGASGAAHEGGGIVTITVHGETGTAQGVYFICWSQHRSTFTGHCVVENQLNKEPD